MNFQTLGDETPDNPVEEINNDLSPDPEVSESGVKKTQISRETLGLVGVLLICAGVVGFMYLRNGPQAAGAAATSASGSEAVVDQFLGDGDQHVKMMQKALQHTDAVVEEFRTYPSRAQVPLSDLSTNPFREAGGRGGAVETETEAAARHRRELERADAMKSAGMLRLQSVVSGPRGACLIDNTLVQPGQSVEGFTVEQIGSDSVIVRRGQYRFELKMK